MRFFTARRLALAGVTLTLLLLSVIPGCSRQGEGERCGSDSAPVGVDDNADCADGLTCTLSKTLKNGDANRCCYAGRPPTDSRCNPDDNVGATGIAGGSSTAGATGGGAGPGTAGASSSAGASDIGAAAGDASVAAGAGGA